MKNHWIIQGMRPKTLIAGAVPPIVAYGHFLGVQEENSMGIVYFILCVLLALFIQIATNFYNDAIDFRKGADEQRVGPSRVTTQLNISDKIIMRMGHLFILLAFIVGIPLIIKGGIFMAILGVVSLFLAYGYTGGPFPLAYLGLGELFVILFFGIVATVGSYYIYTGQLGFEIFFMGVQLGFLSSVLIAINNFRDRETDIKVNKKTLATKMSTRAYLTLIDGFLFIPYLLIIYFTITIDLKLFFPIFAIPIAHKIRQELRNIENPEMCNPLLALSAKHLMLFGVLQFISQLVRA